MNFSFIRDRRSFSDFIFILWAGGAALLSYSLVYALRKPFTAATFDGLSICSDYYSDFRLFVGQVYRH